MKTLPNGAVVPVDTLAVAAAKRSHQNAGCSINPSGNAGSSFNPSRYTGAQHVPSMKTLPNGAVVPADTPAVAAAKRAHQNAGGSINPSGNTGNSFNPSSYTGAQHVPSMKTLPNGAVVPVDTLAVAAAKRAHQNAGGSINQSGN